MKGKQMADSFVSKLITELTAKTTAADTDLVPIADSNGNFFKMTWQKMKQLLLGTKDISNVGDGTVTGAISELNTKFGHSVLTSGLLEASKIGLYTYFIVDNLSKYDLVLMKCTIGEESRLVLFSPALTDTTFICYASASWNGKATFLCDFSNNRVGINPIALSGWTAKNCKITNVVGLVQK